MRIGWVIDMQLSPISFLQKATKSNTITDDVMNSAGQSSHNSRAAWQGSSQRNKTKEEEDRAESRRDTERWRCRELPVGQVRHPHTAEDQIMNM